MTKSEDRIRRAYNELFSGYDLTGDQVLNDVVHVSEYSGMVRVRDISFYTFCEHHFLPFFGTAEVSYQPNTIVTGLGKIVRLVRDVHARRLQIQETMARDIANDIQRILEPRGVCVKLSAKHLCMCSRGPSDDSSFTDVVYRTGTLADFNTD